MLLMMLVVLASLSLIGGFFVAVQYATGANVRALLTNCSRLRAFAMVPAYGDQLVFRSGNAVSWSGNTKLFPAGTKQPGFTKLKAGGKTVLVTVFEVRGYQNNTRGCDDNSLTQLAYSISIHGGLEPRWSPARLLAAPSQTTYSSVISFWRGRKPDCVIRGKSPISLSLF